MMSRKSNKVWFKKNYSLGSESTDGGALGHELDGDPGVVGGHEVGVLPCDKVTYKLDNSRAIFLNSKNTSW